MFLRKELCGKNKEKIGGQDEGTYPVLRNEALFTDSRRRLYEEHQVGESGSQVFCFPTSAGKQGVWPATKGVQLQHHQEVSFFV